jgi:hypothetical protein
MRIVTRFAFLLSISICVQSEGLSVAALCLRSGESERGYSCSPYSRLKVPFVSLGHPSWSSGARVACFHCSGGCQARCDRWGAVVLSPCAPTYFSCDTVGVTPQGWMRKWDANGRVSFTYGACCYARAEPPPSPFQTVDICERSDATCPGARVQRRGSGPTL